MTNESDTPRESFRDWLAKAQPAKPVMPPTPPRPPFPTTPRPPGPLFEQDTKK